MGTLRVTTAETVTIILSLPNRVLHPNCPVASRGGRFKKAAAQKKQRGLARTAVLAEGVSTGPWEMSELQATFFHAQDRRRDGSNYLHALKGAIDGIVDAGLMVDDDHRHLTELPPIFDIDKAAPRVELAVTRVR